MHAEKIVALNHETSGASILYALVESNADHQRYRISDEYGQHLAVRAFSCLIEPLPGDTVLYSRDARQGCHILSIIDRPGRVDARLLFDGDVTIQSAHGDVNLAAAQNASISARNNLSQIADDYSLMARQSLINIDDLKLVGRSLLSRFDKLHSISGQVENIADHLVQRFKNVFRCVSQVDHSRSREVIQDVENLYALRSKQATILAKSDIKIDAERIHMG